MNRICPLLAIADHASTEYTKCEEEECAWFVRYDKSDDADGSCVGWCAITLMARAAVAQLGE